MGRPRSRNVAMINGRITVEQLGWLEARAEELGGNLSAALRQAITDARLLEAARDDYKRLLHEHPDWTIPRDDDGKTRALDFVLGLRVTETDDMELGKQDAGTAG